MGFTEYIFLRLVATASVLNVVHSFYLPGFAPREYMEGQKVDIKVNKLTSTKTQLPYSYYTLPYCKPPKIQANMENLGETLMGDQIENSPYQVSMLKNETCKVLCKLKLDEKDKNTFREMIKDEYVVNLILDNLPAATRYRIQQGSSSEARTFEYVQGFLVGVKQGNKHFVHNHFLLDIQYHLNPDMYNGYRIVGFEVEPASMRQSTQEDKSAPSGMTAICVRDDDQHDIEVRDEIVYTYDVRWTYSEVRWASRWDNYLKMTASHVHWFAILNSLLILFFMSGTVAMIILRTLHRDITKYNELATSEEQAEETGWKLVHGDVFRAPYMSTLFCVSVGSGMQILGMSAVTLVFALVGFLSPAQRGALLQSMMLLYTIMGFIAGYTSARFCKVMEGDGKQWRVTTLLTAILYPGLFFVVFFILNLFIWSQGSSGAVPFTTLFALVVLWFGVSMPLVLLGAHAGYRQNVIELPVRVCKIPRNVPETDWYVRSSTTCFAMGVIPFGAIFTELFFIMSSIWQHHYYYLFGFLTLVLVILFIACAEISMTCTYFQLTTEDYNWWWPSFGASGSSALYVFIYSITYFSDRLQIDRFVSSMLYFGYMGVMSVMFALLTGSIGAMASFLFVRSIYGSIKID